MTLKQVEKTSKKGLNIVTPEQHGDRLKNNTCLKKNRNLASCSFRGKGLVQGVAT